MRRITILLKYWNLVHVNFDARFLNNSRQTFFFSLKMPEDKNGKPSIKPKPATFSVKRDVTQGMFSASSCGNSTSQTPQPMPRKSKLKASMNSTPSHHAISALQQTKPPEDWDTVITIPTSKSTISFDDDNADGATSDTRFYSTISRTIEKKVFFKHYSCDIGGTKDAIEDEIALTHNAPTLAKVCWKSEEFLAVEPIAAIEEMELRSESLASLDNIPSSQQQARIEPSPERFLDDILRKKKSVKIFPTKYSIAKDLEEIEAALLNDPTRLSNIIPSVDECISLDDHDVKSTLSKRQSVEYVNIRDGKHPLVTENLPFYGWPFYIGFFLYLYASITLLCCCTWPIMCYWWWVLENILLFRCWVDYFEVFGNY